MKVFISVFFCMCYLIPQSQTIDSAKCNPNRKIVIPINKYKSKIGADFFLGNLIAEQDGWNINLALITPVFGISYERFIKQRNALTILFSYAKSYAANKPFLNSGKFLNAEFETLKIGGKFYLKKTRDHFFIDIGLIEQWRNVNSDTVSLKMKQANIIIGFGFCIYLKQVFPKIKSDRFSVEIFYDQGIPFTTFYKTSMYKYSKEWMNQTVSTKMICIKYDLN